MRRYISYLLIADDGQVNEDYTDYRVAVSNYFKALRYNQSATLYGRTIEGEMRVIYAKK